MELKKEHIIQFIKENSWKNRVEKIFKILEEM